jgi:hypothetical protein
MSDAARDVNWLTLGVMYVFSVVMFAGGSRTIDDGNPLMGVGMHLMSSILFFFTCSIIVEKVNMTIDGRK